MFKYFDEQNKETNTRIRIDFYLSREDYAHLLAMNYEFYGDKLPTTKKAAYEVIKECLHNHGLSWLSISVEDEKSMRKALKTVYTLFGGKI